MKYSIETNIPFKNTSVFSNRNNIVISPYSNRIRNLGHRRWLLKYKNKKYYKTNPELYRIMLGTFGYSKPRVSVTFSKNGRKYKFGATLRNMVFNTESNLKNNNNRKHYLIFYLDPFNKEININFKNVKGAKITFINKILQEPRFKYGYCHNDRWRSCHIKDYLGNTKYYQGHITDISTCKPFDTHKGPFNSYCANF